MASKVFFANMRASSHKESLPKKILKLFDAAGFSNLIEENDLVAIKLHFGERGSTAFIHPVYVRQVVDKVREAGGKPFLTDTNTLYVGKRANSVDHIQTAIENGFSYATVQAPIIIADGLFGKNYVEVPIGGKHFKSVKIGSDIANAQAMIVLSHTKGHVLCGFGGTLKNLGMGCGNRGGKQMMHSTVKPKVSEDKCKVCGNCLKWCPGDAIFLLEDTAQIDQEKCLGCGECTVVCPTGAIKIRWESTAVDVQERIAEYALGAIKDKSGKVGFFNFVMNVTPDCDCQSWSDAYIVNDVGILASTDPVAIDQAALDLINEQQGLANTRLKGSFKPGEPKFRGVYPDIDHEAQLSHAESLGMGSRKYELVTV